MNKSYSIDDVNKCRLEIISLLRSFVQDERVDDVISYMDSNSFFSYAASSEQHNNFYGGLAKHSLEVYLEADRLSQEYCKDTENNISRRSIVIASLLHDICKMNKYPCVYGEKPKNNRHIDNSYHGKKSVDILDKIGLNLTDEEKLAIRWHMGRYTEKCNLLKGESQFDYIKVAMEHPLAGIIMAADSNAASIAKGNAMRYQTYSDFKNSLNNNRKTKHMTQKPRFSTLLKQAQNICDKEMTSLTREQKDIAKEFYASGMAFRLDCESLVEAKIKLEHADTIKTYLKANKANPEMFDALDKNDEFATDMFIAGMYKENGILNSPHNYCWDSERWLEEFEDGKKSGNTHPARIKVWKDTVKVVQRGSYYTDASNLVDPQFNKDILKQTRFYKTELPQIERQEQYSTYFDVHNGDCLEVTKTIYDKDSTDDLCVLNLASYSNPGGGVNSGAGAQEEYLFRCTDYFRSLFQYASHFDPKDYGIPRAKDRYPLDRNFGGCYSHGVTVFRDTEVKGYAYLEQPWKVNFVAAAVSRLARPYEAIPERDISLVINTIRTILRVSYINGQRRLVLGALGCGAFNHPPKHMAQLFKQVLEEPEFKNAFKEIHFAIFDDHNANKKGVSNIEAFKEVFKK